MRHLENGISLVIRTLERSPSLLMVGSVMIAFARRSMAMLKREQDGLSPCWTPLFVLNRDPMWPLIIIVAAVFEYTASALLINHSAMLYFSSRLLRQ